MNGSFLGPKFDNDTVRSFLEEKRIPHHFYDSEKELLDKICEYIEEGKIIGWFQGRMEFGPRALGGRSIIGDARNSEMQTKINLSIKFRESFRPFAPSVLEEDFSSFFELKTPSPYMLMVAPVKKIIFEENYPQRIKEK